MLHTLLLKLPFNVEIPKFLIDIYGPEQPHRHWFIGMTMCVLMLFFKNYRRIGGIGLVSLICAMFMWDWLNEAYKQYTPDPHPTPKVKKYTTS